MGGAVVVCGEMVLVVVVLGVGGVGGGIRVGTGEV